MSLSVTNPLYESNIKRALFRMSMPAMTAMFINALYNVTDSVFVGKGIGASGIAAVNLVFPVQLIFVGLGSMMGIGCAAMISIKLGEKDKEGAERLLANILYTILILSPVITALGHIFKRQLLALLGAEGALYEMTESYLSIILSGTVFVLFPVALNNIMRAQGLARESMNSMLISALINIALDPIMIFALKMGTAGAALATVLARSFSLIYLVRIMLHSDKREIDFRPKMILPVKKEYLKALGIGGSVFVRQAAGSVLALLVNKRLMHVGTQDDVAIFAIFQRFSSLLFMPLLGIGQGAQPLLGYNFGAGEYRRIREIFGISMAWTSLTALSGAALMSFFPAGIIGFFVSDPEFVRRSVPVMRILASGFAFIGIHIMISTFFQSVGRVYETIVSAGLRQLILTIPAMYILSGRFGVKGLWYAFPFGDIAGALILALMMLFFLSRLPAAKPERNV